VRRRRRKAEPGDDAAGADPDPEETPQQKRAAAQVADAVAALNARYEADGRTFRIESVAGGRQMMTLPAFGPVVARLKGVREQGRLTQAALETLAIIAYRQPILRADLESIRGVACGEVLRSLMERRFVKIVGRADEVGRPMLYGTTTEFLKQFGIGRIDDLPSAKDLR
jgi:segregation and condensation protein B